MSSRTLNSLRVAFLGAVGVGTYASLRDSGPELRRAFAELTPSSVVAAFLLSVVGLALTGLVWRIALGSLGVSVPFPDAMRWFFVGQLGKYIPGGVWSFVAHGVMASEDGHSSRVVASATGVLVWMHVASGVLVSALLAPALDRSAWIVLAVPVAAVALSGPVLRGVASRLAGATCRLTARDALVASVMMVVIWSAYGAALGALVRSADPADLAVLTASFAAAHVVGLLVPVAPAGLGAREVVLVLLASASVGLATASVVAVASRVVHAAADVLVAAAAWAWGRHYSDGESSASQEI